ncbi:MAG: cytochrome c biogenesis CcdA family protein [Caldimonas sp.]
MSFGPGSYALGYLAGALSTLSPCVLPLLPILVASALAQHRLGLWALGAGLALSFTAVGLFVATVGVAIGIDGGLLHRIAGAVLVVLGAVMLVPRLQAAFAAGTARLAGGGSAALARTSGRGWRGQLAVGALLGVVWTPCVGPTLGAASTLAGQGQQLGEVAALMLVFGLGAATPLVGLGTLSSRLAVGSRRAWLGAAETVRRGVGALLVVFGLAIVTGIDKHAESWLVDASPGWLTELTTRF